VSLRGNLENVPLLDILQIVAFSRKTGSLIVQAAQGEAALVFENGLIVSSFVWDTPPLQDAGLPEAERSALIRERIEVALARLARLREAPFSFEVTAEPARVVGGHDLSRETLSRGLNPQELLLDLAKGIEEDRRDSLAALESAFVEPAPEVLERVAAQEPAGAAEDLIVVDVEEELTPEAERFAWEGEATSAVPGEADRHRIVLLLEDDADARRVLAGALVRGGCQVVEAGDPLSAFRKARGLADVGLPFVLVADRGMPTTDHASFDGGLEAVKRLQQAGLHPPILLMTDRMTGAIHARARRLGVSRFVFKPGLSRLDPAQFEADLQAFAGRMLEDVLPGLERIAEARGSSPATVALPRRIDDWEEVTALQRRLEELHGPRDAFQVSTLVMKVAREFFERAVLFVVKDEALRGLAGFGSAAGDEISLLVRELVVPLDVPSVFERVVAKGRSFLGPLSEEEWARFDQGLGRFRSTVVALLPLLTHRETIALLLGDNPDTGAEPGRLETLEVFLSQAGTALETAFLERKLEARTREAAGGLQDVDSPDPDFGAPRDALGDRRS